MFKRMFLVILFFALYIPFGFTADNDGDGLSNEVEADLGSDPNRKDIFVEVDWFVVNGRDLRPRGDFVSIIESIYQLSNDVQNPNRIPGIKIHIELSEAIRDDRDAIGFTRSKGAYDWTDFDAIKQRYFTPSKRNTHHYCLFVKDLGNEQGKPLGNSGMSRNKGNFRLGASDFIVALGGDDWYNYPSQNYYKWTQIGTFMHELGHNLGLKHGGVADHINFKPNHLSVMNYAFQTDGIPFTRGRIDRYRWYSYSTRTLASLKENNLNEQTGWGDQAYIWQSLTSDVFGTIWYLWDGKKFVSYETYNARESIDWNQDGILDSSVTENINQDVRIDQSGNVFHKISILKGSEEWSQLVFNGGLIGKTGIMEQSQLPQTTNLKCLSFKEHKLRGGSPAVQYPRIVSGRSKTLIYR